MKKVIFILSLISIWINGNAQTGAPQLINYQAIARDAAGNVITTPIGVKFEILQTAGMVLVYSETQNINPSAAGIFTAAIGGGTPTFGTFATIGWGLANHYIRVSIDPAGGTSYSVVGTNQLLSVPYALYSEKTKAPLVGLAGNVLSINGSTVNLPGGTTYTAGTGISISGSTITNTAPDQTVNISNGVNTTVNGTYPNYTIDATPNLSISGSSLSITGGNTVVLPGGGITYTAGTGIAIAGGTITNTAPAITYTAGPGISITGGTITNTAPAVTPTITGAGITSVAQAGNSYTVSTITPTLVGAGTTTITGSYPTFTINSAAVGGTAATVPTSLSINAPHSVVTNTLLNSSTITIVSPTITGTGIISSGGSFPNFTLSAPIPSISAAGAATVTGAYPSFTVSAPAPGVTSSTITGVGVATVSPLTGNNFTVNVPPTNLSYNGGTGVLSFSPAIGTNTINITPALGFTTGVLSVGPLSNTINVTAGGPWTKPTATIVALGNINDNVGIGTNSPTEKLQVQTGASADISIVATGANSANLNFGTNVNHFLGTINYNGSTNNMSFNSNGFANRLFFEFSGRVGMGTNAPVSDLDINGSLRLGTSKLFFGPVGGVNSGYTGIYENSSDLRFAVFKGGAGITPFAPGGNSIDAMTIKSNTGFVGIGTNAPSAKLEINSGTPGVFKISDGTQAAGRVLTSDAAGLGTWAAPAPSPGTGTANYLPKWNAGGNLLTPTSLVFDDGSNVTIGVTSNPEPDGRLNVVNSNMATNGLNGIFIDVQNSSNQTNNLTGIRFTGSSAASWYTKTAIFVPYSTGLFGVSDMIFALNNQNNTNIVNTADARMIIKNSGNVGIGTTTPGAQLEVNQFTKLGSAAPAIQMKKLTGISAPSQGGSVNISFLPINPAKILSISVMIDYSGGNNWIMPGYTINSGYEFNWYVSGTDIVVWNKAGTSINLLSKPVQILVTYEQ